MENSSMFLSWIRRRTGRNANAARRPGRSRGPLSVEVLEKRDLLAVFTPCHALSPAAGSSSPTSTTVPAGYTPSQIRQAYGFDQITFNNGTVIGDGSGQTIAIVAAYDDPNIANDLHQFDQYF